MSDKPLPTKEQRKRMLYKLRRMLKPAKRRYVIQFQFKGGNAPNFRTKRYWAVNGKAAIFPTYESAWLALDCLPWTTRCHLDGYRLVSACVQSV